MKEFTMTYAKSHLDNVLKTVDKENAPVVITKQGTPRYVIIDIDSFDRLRSSDSLLNMIAKTEDSIEGEMKIR